MLSAKGRETEVNKGLSIGADLYVTKPFSTRELMAKIKGLLDQGSEPRSGVNAGRRFGTRQPAPRFLTAACCAATSRAGENSAHVSFT